MMGNYNKHVAAWIMLFSIAAIVVFANNKNVESSYVEETKQLRTKELITLHEWTSSEVIFTNPQGKNKFNSVFYTKEKILPVDVDIEYGDDGYHRTFLTVPRFSNKIPYSLAVITDSDNATVLNPTLSPFPSYDWHSSVGRNCSGITSAIRTFIDKCWRLWIVDLGQINSVQHCPPQILAFDLVTDLLVYRHVLPMLVYTPGVSVFTALIVDVDTVNGCDSARIYIADPWGYGLIVHDILKNKSWRVQHPWMGPEHVPKQTNSAGDGIFGISISPKDIVPESQRRFFFHTLNSHQEISVPLYAINNASLWTKDGTGSTANEKQFQFSILGNRRTQCESESMDRAGNLYCSIISSNAIIVWRQKLKYDADNLLVVAFNPDQIKFLTGLKININPDEEEELWALSSNPMLFVGGTPHAGDFKFRIIGCRTRDLLENKPCTVAAKNKK